MERPLLLRFIYLHDVIEHDDKFQSRTKMSKAELQAVMKEMHIHVSEHIPAQLVHNLIIHLLSKDYKTKNYARKFTKRLVCVRKTAPKWWAIPKNVLVNVLANGGTTFFKLISTRRAQVHRSSWLKTILSAPIMQPTLVHLNIMYTTHTYRSGTPQTAEGFVEFVLSLDQLDTFHDGTHYVDLMGALQNGVQHIHHLDRGVIIDC